MMPRMPHAKHRRRQPLPPVAMVSFEAFLAASTCVAAMSQAPRVRLPARISVFVGKGHSGRNVLSPLKPYCSRAHPPASTLQHVASICGVSMRHQGVRQQVTLVAATPRLDTNVSHSWTCQLAALQGATQDSAGIQRIDGAELALASSGKPSARWRTDCACSHESEPVGAEP
jgi:hypothetical protein